MDLIRAEVFSQLYELSRTRILDERFSWWIEAYEHRGTGSTRVRAKDIVGIYQGAAPVPGEMPGSDQNEFVFEIRELVAEAIEHRGGKPLGWMRDDNPYQHVAAADTGAEAPDRGAKPLSLGMG